MQTMLIRVKRVYEEPSAEDGYRILVDRLWPRGLRKEKAKIDLWMRNLAPSDKLRRWFGHKPERWKEFKQRYFKELREKEALLKQILEKEKEGAVTLLYSTKDTTYNNAIALKEYIELARRPLIDT